ncbi:MAG TPA: DUF397 domain-containing protein [Rugosimonospora sp.]|nr:DUF397 domain-containing protein [Rugosimonospora sp.]
MSRLMDAGGAWVKSAASGDGNSCVEAQVMVTGVNLRDSKGRTGPVLSFDTEQWEAFLAGARGGEFNLS